MQQEGNKIHKAEIIETKTTIFSCMALCSFSESDRRKEIWLHVTDCGVHFYLFYLTDDKQD